MCPNKTEDMEFKINISTEDIDNIIHEIDKIKVDSKPFKEFNVVDKTDDGLTKKSRCF